LLQAREQALRGRAPSRLLILSIPQHSAGLAVDTNAGVHIVVIDALLGAKTWSRLSH